MSALDVYNTFQLQDAREDAKGSSQIMELGQRADYINRSVGSRPESWYEFKKKNAENLNLNPLGKAIIGAVVGLAIGAAVMLGVAALAGASLTALSIPTVQLMLPALGFGVMGAIIGQNREVRRENKANEKLVRGYDAYLTGFEQSHARTQGVESSINYRDDHAEKVRNQAAQLALSQSR